MLNRPGVCAGRWVKIRHGRQERQKSKPGDSCYPCPDCSNSRQEKMVLASGGEDRRQRVAESYMTKQSHQRQRINTGCPLNWALAPRKTLSEPAGLKSGAVGGMGLRVQTTALQSRDLSLFRNGWGKGVQNQEIKLSTLLLWVVIHLTENLYALFRL